VRYDYVYLWYVKPRFKMRFGSYFQLESLACVVFHLSGGIGTHLAMWIGFITLLPRSSLLAWGCFVLFPAAAMQVGAFVAEWVGGRMLGPFRLSNLTNPTTAAMELKRHYLARQS
jgi:hypothetical protein